MHPARPQAPAQPCPACGSPVDPLRAPAVVLLDDGFRYLCGARCRTRFDAGERSHDCPEPIPAASPKPEPTTQLTGPTLEPLVHAPAELPSTDVIPPWWGLALAAGALCASPLGELGPWALLPATLACASATLSFRALWPMRAELGALTVSLGPVGVALASIGAAIAALSSSGSWSAVAGTAVAAAAVAMRGYWDERARGPVRAAAALLLRSLPPKVRVPVEAAHDPSDLRFVEVDTADVRAGEEVLALEGETVAVDGVVRAGEAHVLLHASAVAPVLLRQGDPIVAGARVTRGAVRMLVTRGGDERAAARPSHFNEGPPRQLAPITNATRRIVRWVSVAALGASAVSLALAGGQLAAAGAVLIVMPLIAMRRAAEQPFVAAAAMACQRGMVFQNARALDAAGSAAIAAVCTRGTMTEGTFEVEEIEAVGDGDLRTLTAAAAAAEAAAGDHPVALAIQRFAAARGVVPDSVRRATYHPGRGVTALDPGGEHLVIGNRRLLIDEGVSVAIADESAARAEARGRTVIFVGLAGRAKAVISLRDDVRASARAAVQRLMDMNVEVVLLSGDHRAAVEHLAAQLDVDNVRAELLPDERGAEVRSLKGGGGPVATVGHRRHDDEALAAADVPVVLGAAGDAMSDRGVALATDDVRDATASLWIARVARRSALSAALVCAVLGVACVASVGIGLAGPGVAGIVAAAMDAYAIPTGARLLRRIALRVPTGD